MSNRGSAGPLGPPGLVPPVLPLPAFTLAAGLVLGTGRAEGFGDVTTAMKQLREQYTHAHALTHPPVRKDGSELLHVLTHFILTTTLEERCN